MARCPLAACENGRSAALPSGLGLGHVLEYAPSSSPLAALHLAHSDTPLRRAKQDAPRQSRTRIEFGFALALHCLSGRRCLRDSDSVTYWSTLPRPRPWRPCISPILTRRSGAQSRMHLGKAEQESSLVLRSLCTVLAGGVAFGTRTRSRTGVRSLVLALGGLASRPF